MFTRTQIKINTYLHVDHRLLNHLTQLCIMILIMHFDFDFDFEIDFDINLCVLALLPCYSLQHRYTVSGQS